MPLDRTDLAPAADAGFFGPGSVTWRVWSHPTGLTVGFQRAVVVEELDPNLIAAVDQTGDIYARPRTRFDRTVRYFATAVFGAAYDAVRAADVLVKVHSKGIGVDPVTGGEYDANDPSSQLWIHLTAWHSVLLTYERFGPGPLTATDEAEYWRACRVAAELQTIDPSTVPTSREGVRAYFDEMRPRLAGSEAAQRAMDHLLTSSVMLPEDLGVVERAVGAVTSFVLRRATISTMPRWMRRMGGLRQSAVVDAAVRPVMRLAMAVAAASPRLQLELVRALSPSTVPVVGPALMGIPPLSPATTTPREAQALHGFDPPAEAHAALRERQRRRVLGEGLEPSDEGLVESEPLLGSRG